MSAGSRQSSGQLVCAATAEVQAGSMYDRPQLYDDAFSYRDFKAEVSRFRGAASITEAIMLVIVLPLLLLSEFRYVATRLSG
jgi:hypothetical protein